MMSDGNEDRRKYHIEKRNAILSELQRIYAKNSDHYSNDLNIGSVETRVRDRNDDASTDGLLREITANKSNELRSSNANKVDEFNNGVNRSRNLFESCEEVSDSFIEYVADLNFVQSITWLKAATRSMKNISTEQFHLVFYEQWNNNGDIDNNLEFDNQESPYQDRERSNKTFNSDVESKVSPDFDISLIINELNSQENNISKSLRDNNSNSTIFTEKTNDSSDFTSLESLDRYFNIETDRKRNANFDDRIIPDTDEESSSDIFRDTSMNQDNNGSINNDKNNSVSSKYDLSKKSSIEELSLTPPSRIYLTQTSQDKLLINNHSTLQKDSAYETYQSFNSEYPLILKHIQDVDIISFENIEDIHEGDENFNIKTPKISSAGKLVDATKKVQTLCKYSQQSQSLVLEDGTRYKKKNAMRSCSQEIPIKKAKYQGNKEKKLRFTRNPNKKSAISSHWLKFTLDTLNADEVAFQSVQMILAVLQSEKIAKQYMRKRCWKNTLEEVAVNEILNFCNVFEADNVTRVCTNEIVNAVTSLIDNSIENDNLNKVTISIHRISIITQFCASTKVCVEIIDYLTEKLKCHEDIIIFLNSNTETDMYDITHRLHIIFYALKLCLEQYRSAIPNKWNYYQEEVILPVTDLWKKQLGFEEVTLEDDVRQREQRWLTILDNFTVNATDNLVLFAKKSRKLVDFLTHE